MKFPKELIKELEKRYYKYWWRDDEELNYKEISSDLFKHLIFTILSQNTSNNNTRRAYISLKKHYSIDPFTLSKLDPKELSEVIRPGGLHNIKANRIIKVSKFIVENYGGDLRKILSFPKEEIRKKLLEIDGIGEKTADVIMISLFGQKEYFVVDTHMRRIAKRLGLVDEKASYSEIQKALKEFLPLEEDDERIWSLFWFLAKYTCNSRKPKCEECILNNICRYYKGKTIVPSS
jgi:endonuclease-3